MKRITLPTVKDWHEWRMNGIGGSDAGALMTVSPWLSREQLWALKTERALPAAKNRQMHRGLALESDARREYERMTGTLVVADVLGEHDTLSQARASFDGMNFELQRVLEIKCPGRADHSVALAGKIPTKYLWQCVHLCLVSGFDQVDYFSFDGEQGVIVVFKRDEKLERRYLAELTRFWEAVLADEEPPPLKSAARKPQPPRGGAVISFQDRLKKIQESTIFKVKKR